MKKLNKFILLACLILPNLSCGQSVIEVVSSSTNNNNTSTGFFDIGKWETKEHMLRPKEDFALIFMNNKLYAIGGDAGSVGLADNDVYDIVTNKWDKKTPMSKNRSGLAAAAVNGKIYAIGGFDSGATDANKWLNTVEAYDPVTDLWESKSSMLTQRSGLGVGVIENKIYAVGGNLSESGWLNKLEVYKPSDNSWQGLSEMPTARAQAAVGAANNRLYVFGGRNSEGVLGAVEEYDPKTDKWTSRTSLPTPRANAEVAVIGNNIFVMGGSDGTNKKVNTVEVYNAYTDKWVQGTNLPAAKEGFGSQITTDGNTIYICGGSSDKILDTLETASIVKK